MSRLERRLGLTIVIACALLAALTTLSSLRWLSSTFDLAVYLVVSAIFFLDLVDFGIRLSAWARVHGGWRMASVPTSVPLPYAKVGREEVRSRLAPYALLVSVFNAKGKIDDFLEAMEPLRERLWIIDDGSTDGTRLHLIRAGFRCLDGGTNRKKPGAIRQLLGRLPPAIETVVVLDPDTVLDGPGDQLERFEQVLFDFQRSGMAAFCPRVRVRDDGLLARFQGLEFTFGCSFGRKVLQDHSTNAGVSVYRRVALAEALEHHSLSVYAEDLEISLILLSRGDQIYFDERLEMETEGKRTWRGLFSQRVGWSYGLMRVYALRFADVLRVARRGPMSVYHYLVYAGAFQILLHPLRIAAVLLIAASLLNGIDDLLGLGFVPDGRFTSPAYFVAVYLKFTALSLLMLFVIVPKDERGGYLPAALCYLFYQVFHIGSISVGYANWFSVRLLGRRLYRDHYQDEASLRGEVHG